MKGKRSRKEGQKGGRKKENSKYMSRWVNKYEERERGGQICTRMYVSRWVEG